MSAERQIKAFIDRILRLKEEQDTLGEDIRDVYAEAKSMGFDKTAMGNVVAHLRKVAKKGHDTVAEQGAVFDIYLAAYEGHAPAPARVRENIEKFPSSDGGAFAAVKGNARLANAAGVDPSPSEHIDPATGEITQIATNEGGANQEDDQAEGGSPDLEPSGPEAERATLSTTKPKAGLRPNCRNPGEACGGYGDVHCHACKTAVREKENAA